MVAPLLVAVAYYVGAQAGFLLTPSEHPVSTLWPPNAILFGALLLAPQRTWPLYIAAAFGAHLAIELHSGVPMGMVLCWFISNTVEAVVGAAGVRFFTEGRPNLDTFRRVNVFIGAVLFAVFSSSFLDAAFVALNHYGTSSYWDVWRIRFFSNVLAVFTLVPVMLAFDQRGRHGSGPLTRARISEGVLLTTSLLAVCAFVFTGTGLPAAIHAIPALLYAPLPFLLWAAVRFGPAGASGCLMIFAVLSVWGAIHGHGPFVGYTDDENVLSLQLFLIVTYIPLLALTAVLRERKRAAEEARSQRAATESRPDRGTHLRRGIGRSTSRMRAIRPSSTRVHPDDMAVVEAAISRAMGGADAYEVEFRHAPARKSLGAEQRTRHSRRARHAGPNDGRNSRHHRAPNGRSGAAQRGDAARERDSAA